MGVAAAAGRAAELVWLKDCARGSRSLRLSLVVATALTWRCCLLLGPPPAVPRRRALGPRRPSPRRVRASSTTTQTEVAPRRGRREAAARAPQRPRRPTPARAHGAARHRALSARAPSRPARHSHQRGQRALLQAETAAFHEGQAVRDDCAAAASPCSCSWPAGDAGHPVRRPLPAEAGQRHYPRSSASACSCC